MDTLLFKNNALGYLDGAITPVDTSIVLVDSSQFPTPSIGQYFLATLTDGKIPETVEIIRVNSNDTASGTLTVVRGFDVEDTAARSWITGTKLEMRITAGALSVFGHGIDTSGSIAADSLSLNAGANRVASTIMIGAFPCVKMDDWNDADELYSQAPETVMCSPYFDLGVPATWLADEDYTHGSIVQPTTPDGYQYRAVMPDNPNFLTRKLVYVSGMTEPTWGEVTYDQAITWIQQDPSVGYFMQSPPAGSIFVPTLFGFISHIAVVGPLTLINVSVGTAAEVDRYVSNAVVDVSNPNEFCTWLPAVNLAVTNAESLRFTLTTASTTGRCVGRFFVRGFFVELPDHL